MTHNFEYSPKISIITPVHTPDERWLIKSVNSVISQTYKNWELCICDDCSTQQIKQVLENLERKEARIKIVYSDKNIGISLASNKALSLASGDFVALLDHDDELTSDALFEVVKLVNEFDADMIYSDEDKIDQEGRFFDPSFKPDWSPDLLRSCMYIGHLMVYRKAILDEVNGFRKGYEGSQDYDLALRVAEKTKKIFHIPKVLYHWRAVGSSAALGAFVKPEAYLAGQRALEQTLERQGIKGYVQLDKNLNGIYRIKRIIDGNPLVSIIIPTKDRVNLLHECIASIEKRSLYRNFEIIIVDNNSKSTEMKEYLSNSPHKVLSYESDFNFSAINNFAVKHARGEQIVFLNNDTKVISEDWLESMLEHSQREEVGAVGSKLLYPNGTVQHAGILIGVAGVASHAFAGFPFTHPGYNGLLASTRNCSAVTAACMMIKKKLFIDIGGFDENLPVTFNDVELCLRLREKGYWIVFTPYALLYHYGSGTAAMSVDPAQKEYMLKKWGNVIARVDPCYNPNLNPDNPDYDIREEIKKRYYFTWSSPLGNPLWNISAKYRRYGWFAKNILHSHGVFRLFIEILRFIRINAGYRIRRSLLRPR